MSGCGTYGYRFINANGVEYRHYTHNECKNLNGRWFPGGECLRAEGGSFSYDCRFLNNSFVPPALSRELNTLTDLEEPNMLRWVLLGGVVIGGVVFMRRRK